jgi:hypothetical protein
MPGERLVDGGASLVLFRAEPRKRKRKRGNNAFFVGLVLRPEESLRIHKIPTLLNPQWLSA